MHLLRILLILGIATFPACAGAGPSSSGAPVEPAGTTSPADGQGPDLERLEALYQARADSARAHYHPADVDFMTGMIAHHAQAVLMSHWAPDRASRDAIRTLAARISNAQKDEIALMQRWLQQRDEPAPEVSPEGRVSGHGAHMHMTGMLTDEQLTRLEASTGVTFDSLYLAYMIPHHEGAVTMVHELFATDGAAQGDLVFKLASDIQVDQSSEITRMGRMLDAMRAGSPR